MIMIYGIKNCDTVKKALRWLDEQAIVFEFVDFKKTPPTVAQLTEWCQQVDWELLLNRRGTTWRRLSDEVKSSVDQTKAIELMAEQPSMIKRPVWQKDQHIMVGFTDDVLNALA